MKLLFLTRTAPPQVGGVERHIGEVVVALGAKRHKVKIISDRDVQFPHIKFFGLLYIWFWLFKNRKLIQESDIVHIHDVFIWYLPFIFLYANKKTITTFHGLEWDNPLSKISIWQKRLAAKHSNDTVGAGKFLEKYLKIKLGLITYGGVSMYRYIDTKKKTKNAIVYVGRLEENTGLLKFLEWLRKNNKNKKYNVDFCGDGPLRTECEKYGTVHGFTDPAPFVRKAEICVPGGYLAALEAMAARCRIMVFWNNQIKKDYWQMTPFYKWIKTGDTESAYNWAKEQTWEKLANEYINLYNHVK